LCLARLKEGEGAGGNRNTEFGTLIRLLDVLMGQDRVRL
jgi:hypothetical protein